MGSLHEDLFQPLRVRNLRLANRIVVPPMVQRRPILSPEGIAWYRRLASGGAGMVVVESTGVPAFGSELTVQDLRRLSDAIRERGPVAGIQLFPTQTSVAEDVTGLNPEDISGIVRRYGKATQLCREAGFQAVEIHGAHGFLLNRFFMPGENGRTDSYGGSLEGRCRLALEITQHVREAAGEDMLVMYRHSPRGSGYGVRESLLLADGLVAEGVDVLDVSPAKAESVADLAAPFTERLDIPVIAVGGMEDPSAAAQALRDGRCDLVAVGRQMIADAGWPRKVAEGRLSDIVRCTQCDEGCFGNLGRGQPVRCVLWKSDEVAEWTQ
jgi:2,4-dienoyl-CoA reductase-like NADH-dependent reductase (Old Yellow Enzyme family)